MKFFSNKRVIMAIAVILSALTVMTAAFLLFHGKAVDMPSGLSEAESSIFEYYEPSVEETVVISEASEIYVSSDKNATAELKQRIDSIKQTESNTVKVNTTVYTDHLSEKQIKLSVDFLAQNPQLPTGCEITSLTTVLNYYGYSVDKVTMANSYLEKAEAPANFWKVFLGDPTKNTGFGCYAQPIVNAANKFFAANGSLHTAVNVSNTAFENLLTYVSKGVPVIIWGTMNMKEPYTTYKWTIEDETVQWIAPEHCLVLIGYDIQRSVAIMSDPLRGIVEYDLTTVKERYIALHKQSVIITPQFFISSSNSSAVVSSNYSSVSSACDNSSALESYDMSGAQSTVSETDFQSSLVSRP